jgi:dihydroorotate dehydrogenase (NAD+) catalytic subunit
MTASGTCGYGLELEPWLDIRRLGAVVVKGLSRQPRGGNPAPRIVETPSGLLNSIGLENIGLDRFVAEVLPVLASRGVTVVANVYATCVDDFVAVADGLAQTGRVAAIELNLSCPNVSAGGIAFGQDPAATSRVVEAVRKSVGLPLWVKLTPRVADIAIAARAAEAAGAEALTVCNTFPGMAIDIRTRRPVLGANFGGLSGPAVKPMSLKLVWEACQAVRVPVIAVGGIATWRDVVEFVIAGASAVQVGTAVLIDPDAPAVILDGLTDYLVREGIGEIAALRGTLRLNGG